MQTKLNLLSLFVVVCLIQISSKAQLSPEMAISQMKKGINLGNTLEPPREGDWGNPTTQEYMFDIYKKEGFDCIRIPVRWDKHTQTIPPYKIDETWFNRVEQILDWGLSKGLYIVVNSHHDDWIKTGYSNAVNRARFDSIWSQVATRFKDKPDRLIFEVMNEPVNMTKAQCDDVHQRIISIIRKTNPTRLIIFQGINWGGSDGLLGAAIPNDPYLIGSFHSYDPYLFGLEGQGVWGSSSDVTQLRSKFQAVKDWSVKNNIPVFLGEFGSLRKCDYNSRMKHYNAYVELSHSFGFSSCAWDDGGDFRIMNRSARTWDDDVKDILTHSSELSPKFPRLSLFQDTIVKLFWNNQATDYDSIYIERRLANTSFVKIATLAGAETSYSDLNLAQNREYFYRVIAHYNNGTDWYSYPQKIMLPTYIPKVPVPRQLFTGKALEIPGRIEAEHFDIGEDGLTYHDSDTKNLAGALRPNEPIDIYNLGSENYYVIDNFPGEWLEYSVNVAEKGLYNISASIAAFAGGGTFRVKIGQVESEILKAPTTYSWINKKNTDFQMNLEAGQQIMRITFIEKPLFYLDFLEFKKNIPVGTAPLTTNQRFQVYQNRSAIVVDYEWNQPAEWLRIYNLQGAMIKTIKAPAPNLQLNAGEFSSGVYIFQLASKNQTISQKIVLQ